MEFKKDGALGTPADKAYTRNGSFAKKPKMAPSPLFGTILGGFIVVKVLAMMNPGTFHWFSWFGTIAIPLGINITLYGVGRLIVKLAAKIGFAIGVRRAERGLDIVAKRASDAAKAQQADAMRKASN